MEKAATPAAAPLDRNGNQFSSNRREKNNNKSTKSVSMKVKMCDKVWIASLFFHTKIPKRKKLSEPNQDQIAALKGWKCETK